jgi:hypothetical protein
MFDGLAGSFAPRFSSGTIESRQTQRPVASQERAGVLSVMNPLTGNENFHA